MDHDFAAPLLQVCGLTVHFFAGSEKEFAAVEEATFNVLAGETVALFGESGCGKTTTALALLKLLPTEAHIVRGSVAFRGRELLELSETELRQIRGAAIASIAQEPGLALNPVLRAGGQIAEVIRAHRRWTMRRCREEAYAVLEQVCFSETGRIFSAWPHQLSGGQRQRVIIAQALACDPCMLIADEPTAALDTVLQAEVLALLKELQQRRRLALLFISHNAALLASLADRILVMRKGRIVEQGSAEQICGKPLHPYTRALVYG